MSPDRREPLDREQIVRAAVGLVDRDGLEKFTMRGLGRELGVEAMALYHYFPSNDALVDAIVQTVVAEMRRPPAVPDWQERLRAEFLAYRQVAHAHPNVFPLLGRRPVKNPEALRPVEHMLDILRGAGFSPKQSLSAFRTLSSYAFGYALSEIRGFALEPARDGSDDRFDVRTVDVERFPRMREVAPHVTACDHDAEFTSGLNAILAGLRAELKPPADVTESLRQDVA
ncbi:MAG: TetR/AcrR family transcriptional regulator C-terminal domain-containing protein [Actinobacteria bacterium]|nr:TetR/AcrR family transcriptional regulator C-terminal domain-containing protein [Actinomycetota bacterium]